MKEKENTVENMLNQVKARKEAKEGVSVLYQKLHGQWFAFTEVNGEIFYSAVDSKNPPPELEELKKEAS